MDVFVMKGGARTGPYPVFRLQEMLDDGAISASDPVWHEGMAEWQPLAEAAALKHSLRMGTGPAEGEGPAKPRLDDVPPELQATVDRIVQLSEQQTETVMALRRAIALRRFFARHIDYSLSLGFLALVSLGGWLSPWIDYWDITITRLPAQLASGLITVIIETICVAKTGVTPGKWLLGLRVRAQSGDGPPSWLSSARRATLAWCLGAGLALPSHFLVPLIQGTMAYRSWLRQGSTLWDHYSQTRVEFRPVNQARRVFLLVFISAWLILITVVARMAQKNPDFREGAPVWPGEVPLPAGLVSEYRPQ